MTVVMWRWVYGSLDFEEYDSIESAAAAEVHQDGEWSCVGIEVGDAGLSTWMPRDAGKAPNPFAEAIGAMYERDMAAMRDRASKDREHPVTGIVLVAAPDVADFPAEGRWTRTEWVHDADEEAAAVSRLAAIFGVDRVTVERPRVRA